jgi:hypothetical protein
VGRLKVINFTKTRLVGTAIVDVDGFAVNVVEVNCIAF